MAGEQEYVDHKEFGAFHDALNRMKRAHDRGTGCHLTAEMVGALGITMLAEVWAPPDPRKEKSHG